VYPRHIYGRRIPTDLYRQYEQTSSDIELPHQFPKSCRGDVSLPRRRWPLHHKASRERVLHLAVLTASRPPAVGERETCCSSKQDKEGSVLTASVYAWLAALHCRECGSSQDNYNSRLAESIEHLQRAHTKNNKQVQRETRSSKRRSLGALCCVVLVRSLSSAVSTSATRVERNKTSRHTKGNKGVEAAKPR